MKKIALALILKSSDDEADLLDQCLKNVKPFVDDIFITVTHQKGQEPNRKVCNVATKYGARTSYFTWVNDFSAARNFNFKQVPKDYEYILWCDSDDTFRGMEKLREVIDDNSDVDAFAFWYYYAFDDHNTPVVVHKKTQIIRNDGCVEWTGRLHEDFKENRSLNVKFVEGIERIHHPTDNRVAIAQIRNVEISKEEAKVNPNDPRVYFNLGNSYFGAGKLELAKTQYQKFLKTSQSDEEKFIVHQRFSAVENALGNKESAIEHLLIALGMSPDVPDAYNSLGYLYFDHGMYDNAEKYLLLGLVVKPKYHKMIVYNPRDYDYNPMMALAKVYFKQSRPDYALPLLRGCLKIYPDNKYVANLVTEMEKELSRLEKVLDTMKVIETYGDDKIKILSEINSLPLDLQSHPAICRIRNKYFVKEASSGKDIAYYCGQTTHDWNPVMAKTKGIGGSEEAVINLSKQWAKQGYNVTVFNSCGVQEMLCDGVKYKPFWHYNAKDKYDITILWRNPKLVDYELNTGKILIDLHDVVQEGEFNEKRLKKIDKIMVKTNAHRSLFPNIPDDKFAIVPNGQDFDLFDQKIKKDPMLLVNTSSPDRSMDVLPKLFKMVKEQVPEARCSWAYGWEIWDNTFRNDKSKMEWKEKVIREMEEAGIENMGRLSQKECAKLYLEGKILAYPSEFYEIDCISLKKAQACGCKPISTDFAAFEESNQFGIKIHSKKTNDNWCKPYQFSFGITDEKLQKEWVDAVVKELKTPMKEEVEMMEWSKKFEWNLIADKWSKLF